jgi:hypothetical protein
VNPARKQGATQQFVIYEGYAAAVRQGTEHHPGITLHGFQASIEEQGLRNEQAGSLGNGLGCGLK